MKNLIIFLRGNYAPLVLQDAEVPKIESALAVMRPNEIIDITDSVGSRFHLKTNLIDGWYVREPFRDTQGEALDILKKQVSADTHGEEWKES